MEDEGIDEVVNRATTEKLFEDIYEDYKIDFVKNFYYDVIIGWRVIREGEMHYDLKGIYNRHVLKGSGDPKKFSDFFSPQLFPYCKPQIAKLYAAHDAKITFEEFTWQLPYITKTNSKWCSCNNYIICSIQ